MMLGLLLRFRAYPRFFAGVEPWLAAHAVFAPTVKDAVKGDLLLRLPRSLAIPN
jgi:hypothetical protein